MARRRWTAREYPKAKRFAIHATDRARLNETVARIKATNPNFSDARCFWLAARQTKAYIPKPILSDVTTDLAWDHLRRLYGSATIAITVHHSRASEIQVFRPNYPDTHASGESLGEALSIATHGNFRWPPERLD